MFKIETTDKLNKKKFSKTWYNNMSQSDDAKISEFTGNNEYTEVTFQPDLERFKMNNGFDSDIIQLFKKRSYDMAGIFNGKVKITLNDKPIKIKCFEDYIKLYLGE